MDNNIVKSIILKRNAHLDWAENKLGVEIDQDLRELYVYDQASLKEVCMMALLGTSEKVLGQKLYLSDIRNLVHSL